MSTLLQDLRYALRTFARMPGFTATVVAPLALGTGANTAIFSVINTTFLRSLPYSEPDRLALLRSRTSKSDSVQVSYPDFLDWRAQQDRFSGLAFYRPSQARLKTPEGVETVRTCLVSGDFFAVLGVAVVRGRNLTAGDDQAGAAPAAWVTHEARQRYFPGDDDVVGRTISLDGQAVTVAGVLPPGYRFYHEASFYLPIAPYAQQLFITDRGSRGNGSYALGRLKRESTLDASQTQMRTIAGRLERQYPLSNAGVGVRVLPLREHLVGAARRQQLLLLGAVGMLLMIACVNVANLLLSRSLVRKREMAIRTALGATRLQLGRQLLVEGAVLALAGGLVGTLLGHWGYGFLVRLVPGGLQEVIGSGAGLDGRVLLFALGVSLAAGIAFALVPAWESSHVDPNDALKNTARAPLRTVLGRIRVGDLLVVAQTALALTLLVGAGLLIRSLQQLMRVPSGMEPERVVTVEVESPAVAQFTRDPHSVGTYGERLLQSVQPLAGVESAAIVTHLPFTGSYNSWFFYREDRPVPRESSAFPSGNIHVVSPGYFRTMGIPLLRGRLLDGRETPYVVPPGLDFAPQNFGRIFKDVVLDSVVSRRMADRYWPGEDPVGQRFRLGTPEHGLPWVEIVGVVGSTTQLGAAQGDTAEFYLSLRQWPMPDTLYLAVRTRQNPAGTVASIRRAVLAAAGDRPVRGVRLMSERIASSVSDREFDMVLFACFAGTALFLSLIGIYGVLSFAVSQRTREIGIQMALGADRSDVLRGVLARGLRLELPGILLGLAGAWAVGRLLQSSLFGISSSDATTYACSACVFLLMGFLACVIPARRAAKVDPMVALRCE